MIGRWHSPFPTMMAFGTFQIDRWVSFRVTTRFQAVDDQIGDLRRELRFLSARLHAFESTGPAPSSQPPGTGTASAASLDRILNPPRSPTYVGPTSAEFGLVQQPRPFPNGGNDDVGDDRNDEDLDLLSAAPSPEPACWGDTRSSGDPLNDLGVEETLRLLQVYEDAVGVMYPCVDLHSVRSYAVEYYQSPSPTRPSPAASDQDWFHARDIQLLKILLATALVVESHGRSERAAQLADSVEDRFASRLKIAEVDMKEILILTLLV